MPHAREYHGVPERRGSNILIPIRELEGDELRIAMDTDPKNDRLQWWLVLGIVGLAGAVLIGLLA